MYKNYQLPRREPKNTVYDREGRPLPEQLQKRFTPDRYGYVDTVQPNAYAADVPQYLQDDSDPGDLTLVKDHHDKDNVTQVREREGFIICRSNPFGHWTVYKRRPDNGQGIPRELQGVFTTYGEVMQAILSFRGKME